MTGRESMKYYYHHIHLICSDLENTEAFFSQILGAEVVERKKFGTADGITVDLNGALFCIRKAVDMDRIVSDSLQKRFGYDHVALQVDDVDAAYSELKDKGVTFAIPPKNGTSARIAFFKGPDNITFELYQPLGRDDSGLTSPHVYFEALNDER
jgi:catechol 2,3-dioxygenase-like lactoylglutathione lyase family enzyme